jgi:hypothetical protein
MFVTAAEDQPSDRILSRGSSRAELAPPAARKPGLNKKLAVCKVLAAAAAAAMQAVEAIMAQALGTVDGSSCIPLRVMQA